MKYLLDTHILLWAAANSDRLPPKAKNILTNNDNQLYFSAASIWEIAIKKNLGRKDFIVDAQIFRRALLDNGYHELPINSEQAAFSGLLPNIHKDPFDRILISQASTEGITLITADAKIAAYPGPIYIC